MISGCVCKHVILLLSRHAIERGYVLHLVLQASSFKFGLVCPSSSLPAYSTRTLNGLNALRDLLLDVLSTIQQHKQQQCRHVFTGSHAVHLEYSLNPNMHSSRIQEIFACDRESLRFPPSNDELFLTDRVHTIGFIRSRVNDHPAA
jgi:hypothetical protein